MFKKAKKFLSLILAAVLLSTATLQPVSAAVIQNPSIEPQWKHALSMVLTIHTETNPMSISITVAGLSGTSYSNGYAVLEKTSGTGIGVVKTWSGISGSGPVLQFSDYAGAPTSGTYKLTFSVTTTRNGVSERISMSEEVNC